MCHGAYFKTDVVWKRAPVWKSMTIPQGHYTPMMWFHYDKGWLCNDTLFGPAKDSTDVGICLYARYIVGVDMPRIVHFPYWSKARSHYITVDGLWQYVERKNAASAASSSASAADEKMMESLAEKVPALEPALASRDAVEEASDLGKGDKGSAGKGDMQPRAGWLDAQKLR